MLLIQKGREPASLTAHRKTPYASYDNCNKADIRKSLLAEQGCLCAYCMRRIHEDTMKIEHWYPESELSEIEKMNYSNMLGVCPGHMDGLDGRYDTCDSKKGNTVITVDPRKKEHIGKIAYRTRTGEIYSEDPVFNHDINETLNLNCRKQYLPENRKSAYEAVIAVLSKNHRQGNWTSADIMPVKQVYETVTNGERKEYAGIVLWYLEKLLSRGS